MTSLAIIIVVLLPLVVPAAALEAACDFVCRSRERQFARKSRSDAAQKPWRRYSTHIQNRIGIHKVDYKGRLGFPMKGD